MAHGISIRGGITYIETSDNWQPTLDTHDPNPPLPLDNPRPFSNQTCIAVVSRYDTASVFNAPNVAVRAAIVVAQAPFNQLDWTSLRNPQALTAVTAQANLLTTTLAAVAAPFVPALHAVAIRTLWRASDTSTGTAKPLVEDSVRAFIPPSHAPPPHLLRVNANTSLGMTVQLYAAPFVSVDIRSGVQRPDTLAVVNPPNLLATTLGVVAAPFVPASTVAGVPIPRLLDDTSAGTPKTLVADAQAPVGAGRFESAPYPYRWITDTSTSISKALVDVQAPIGANRVESAPYPYRWVVADCRGTPKTLLADAQTPVGVDRSESAPYPYRWVVAECRGTPKTLLTDAQAPVGADRSESAPYPYRWVVAECRGTPKTLLDDAQAPVGAVRSESAPYPYRWIIAECRGTPKPLIADAQAPVANPYFSALQRPAIPIPGGTANLLSSTLAVAAVPVPALSLSPIEFRRQLSVDTYPNLLALSPSTTGVVFRSPIYAQRPPLRQIAVYTTPNLTATTLSAVAAAPFVPALGLAPASRIWQPQNVPLGTPFNLLPEAVPIGGASWVRTPVRFYQPADTTSSAAKTLTADAQLPFFVAPHFLPIRVSTALADNSHSTPKTLIADAQLPFFVAPHLAQLQHGKNELLPADTSQGMPIPDHAEAFLPAPHLGPIRIPRILADTSYGTPKTLVADAQPPFFVALHLAQLQHGKNELLPADTSQGIAPAFRDVEPPFVPAPHLGPVRASWQPQHFNYGTPKGLIADAQLPFFVAPYLAQLQHGKNELLPADTSQGMPIPDHVEAFVLAPHLGPIQVRRILADTSVGTPKALIADAQLPFFVAPHLAQLQHGKNELLPAETSQGMPIPDHAEAFLPAPHLGPIRLPRILADTSVGTPKTLIDDAQLPFFVAPHLAQLHHGKNELLPADTSQGMPIPDHAEAFVPAPHLAPIPVPRILADTSIGTPKTLINDATPAFVPVLHSAPIRTPRALDETSAGTPKTLIDDSTPAFVPVLHLLPVKRQWQPVDLSQGTAKTLIEDAQAPFSRNWTLPPVYQRQSYDSLRLGTPSTLFAEPFVTAVYIGPQTKRLQPADTSFSSPVALIAAVAAAAPFVPLVQSLVPSRPWLSVNAASNLLQNTLVPSTTRVVFRAPTYAQRPVARNVTVYSLPNLSVTTLTPVSAPFVPVVHLAPVKRTWLLLDQTKGSAKPLLEDAQLPVHGDAWSSVAQQRLHQVIAVQPPNLLVTTLGAAPFIPVVHLAPVRTWLPLDQSKGSAKPLLEDAQLPVHGDAWLSVAQQRLHQVIAVQLPNLSVTTLSSVVVEPPFIPNLYNAIPQWYNFHYQVLAETSYSTPSVLLVVPDVVVPPGPFGVPSGFREGPIRIKVPRSLLLRDDEEIVTFLAALLQSKILH